MPRVRKILRTPEQSLRIYHRRFRGLSSGCYHRVTEEIALYGPSPRAELTFIHEYGHFLDFKILSETSRACSCTPQSKLSGIIKMLRQTTTYAGICPDEGLSKSRARYLRSAVELWARAYTQFIVVKASGDEGKAYGQIYSPDIEWPPEEFAPIALAIDELLDSIG